MLMKKKFFRLIVFFYSVSLTLQLAAQNVAATTGGKQDVDDTILDLLQKGGAIMIPLIICSVVATAIAFERLISLRSVNIVPVNFFPGLVEEQKNEKEPNFKKMREYCQKSKTPIANILEAGIQKWTIYEELEGTEKTLEDVAAREIGKMKRSLRTLKNIAAISPLLGLLGTVFGMIHAFQTVAHSTAASGKADKLANGIYEAMVTTAVGLSIAIPTLLIFYFLNNRVDSLTDDIEEVCNKFIDNFIHRPKSKSK